MQKNDFLTQLQKRASEQDMILHGVFFPHVFVFISRYLGESPWRWLIPLSVILTIIFQMLWGWAFDEKILWLFGGL
ncbi:MAG TPA: hypothetical protein VFQ63_02265 [Patescibacteria group bacterium]|nr:hypothetical protein [Patescibacteria group bacterium]